PDGATDGGVGTQSPQSGTRLPRRLAIGAGTQVRSAVFSEPQPAYRRRRDRVQPGAAPWRVAGAADGCRGCAQRCPRSGRLRVRVGRAARWGLSGERGSNPRTGRADTDGVRRFASDRLGDGWPTGSHVRKISPERLPEDGAELLPAIARALCRARLQLF